MVNGNIKIIDDLWKNVIDEYNKLFRWKFFIKGYNKYLSEGATDEEIKKVEEIMGFRLPKELAELYKCNNGNINSHDARLLGAILGLHFISLEELVKNWKQWCKILDDDELNSYAISTPKKAIKLLYAHKYWIPFAADGGGNHIGIDLDPDVNGCVGQVINFGRDDDKKYVLANNLGEFLELMINVVKSKDFKIVYDRKQPPAFEFVNNDKPKFPTDYLIKLLYK
jgi:cell wall assembly regulator SMI1